MNDKWDTDLPLLFIRNTGTWILILISFVPISLLVSLEYIKFWQSMFMTYEYRMYDEEQNMPMQVQSSNLVEEIG
jgi:phospholipid-transporting ATPase